MTEELHQLLAKVELFSGLSPDELATVAGVATTRSVAKDTVIFHGGDVADAVYVIGSGKVKIVTTSTDGKEFILTVLGAGQVFGEMALVEEGPRSASVVTMTAVELLAIKREDFHHLLNTSPGISSSLGRVSLESRGLFSVRAERAVVWLDPDANAMLFRLFRELEKEDRGIPLWAVRAVYAEGTRVPAVFQTAGQIFRCSAFYYDFRRLRGSFGWNGICERSPGRRIGH